MENELDTQETPLPQQPQSSRMKLFVILMVALVCIAVGVFMSHTFRSTKSVGSASQPKVFVNTDSDFDGLTDAEELKLGTDPHNPDTDGDGLPDGYEVNVSHTDPKNAHSKDPILTDQQWLNKQLPRR